MMKGIGQVNYENSPINDRKSSLDEKIVKVTQLIHNKEKRIPIKLVGFDK